MDSYTRLLKILKSEEFSSYIEETFGIYKEKLKKKIKKEEFVSIFRAFIVEIYNTIDDEIKEKFVDRINSYGLTEDEVDFIIFKINACISKPNDHIDEDSKEFFNDLESYKNKPIAKSLSKYKNEVFKILSEEMGVYTIKQIKEGDYHLPERQPDGQMGEYILDEDEIEIIETAHKAGALLDLGHTLYDDVKYVKRNVLWVELYDKVIKCDYEKADEDGLGNLVFNTLKNGPRFEVDIVFDDGIIIQCHQGNIKRKPYPIDEMLSYIYANVAKILEETGVKDEDVPSMKPDDLSEIIEFSCIEISAQSDSFGEIYSKKMVDNSKKYIKKLVKIAKEENL